jgi:transposase
VANYSSDLSPTLRVLLQKPFRNDSGILGIVLSALIPDAPYPGYIRFSYDTRVEQIAKEVYPEVARLKQVKGVGPLIALTYVLTLDNPCRFRRSRDVGCFVGLRPGRRNSGMSEPQLHISKEGDGYLRTLLVQGAHYILGPFGQDSDLRRWGLKLSERGGRNAKKRAVVAVARKLAVLLHKLWVSKEIYEALRNNRQAMARVA